MNAFSRETSGRFSGIPRFAPSRPPRLFQINAFTVYDCCRTAPEILRQNPYDNKVDVYSFGIVLWEVWTRDLPFKEIKTVWGIREAVEAGQRPPLPVDAPAYYAELMQRCWADDSTVCCLLAAHIEGYFRSYRIAGAAGVRRGNESH